MALPRLKTGADPAALREFREQRGWTLEEMADAVGALPLEVAAWEAGTVRVPPAQAERIRLIAAGYRRRAAEEAPGPGRLPRCAWADAHAPGLHEILWYEPRQVESNSRVQAHLADCSTCRQVRELGQAQRAPAPAPGSRVPAGHLGYGLDSVPRELLLLLAAVAGAVPIVAGFAFVQALWTRYPGLPSPADLWVETLAGIAVLGLARRFTARPLRDRPYTGGLLAGVAGVLAGLFTWTLRNPDADLSSALLLAFCAVLAVVTGLLDGLQRDAAGHDREDDGETPAPAVLPASGAPFGDVPGEHPRPAAEPVAARVHDALSPDALRRTRAT